MRGQEIFTWGAGGTEGGMKRKQGKACRDGEVLLATGGGMVCCRVRA